MDLDFLSPQQLQMTLRLSDILSMQDLSVAAAVLASYSWNIEMALSEMQIGAIPPPAYNNVPQQHYENNYQEEQEGQYYEQENNYEFPQITLDEKKKLFEEEYASLVPLQHTLSEPTKLFNLLDFHKTIAQDSKAHRGEYLLTIMNKSQLVCKNILESSPENKRKYTQNREKIENNRKFINNLYTNYQPRINFTFGTFFLNLTRAYLEGKYLLVYIHTINPQEESKYNKVLSLILRQKEISNFVNANCITYGMFDNSDDYQVVQKYVTPKELPAFAVFRMNKTKREEEFGSSYKVSVQKDIFLEWLADSIGVKLKKRGSQVKQPQVKPQKQVQTEKKQHKENFNPHTYLRAQQDQLYFELQKTYNQKRQLSLQKRQKIKQDEENLLLRIIQAEKQKQPQNGPHIIEIRFRMPISGESKTRRFYLTDKIEKSFMFVDCFCRDQFQQKFNKFELVQTHPSLILSHFKEKTFEEVFDGSRRENIMIREI